MIGRLWSVISVVLCVVLTTVLVCIMPVIGLLASLEWLVYGTTLWVEEWGDETDEAIAGLRLS